MMRSFCQDLVWIGIQKKYLHKLQQKAKVIAAMDSMEMPHFVGLAEIENREVLEDLVRETAIANTAYSIAHIADNDDRGIEVAAIYRADYFRLLHLQAMEITILTASAEKCVTYCMPKV